MQLSIIIVNYNVKYFLEQCLCSVVKASQNIAAEIIVIDNNSSDGSREYFNNRFEGVTFLWETENTGFSRANNKALKYACGELVLFLNPDTIVAEDVFEKCLQCLHQDTSIGALGVKMIDGSGIFLKESKRGFPGPLTSLYKISGFATLFPRSRIFARYYLGNKDENTTQEVDVLAGAFMMVRKTVLELTGSFDENFFMYGEDVDLSYRIQQAGYKNLYLADACILHFKGESTKIGSLNYLKLFYGAMSLFVRKHFSGGTARLYTILIRLAIWSKASLSAIGHALKKVVRKDDDAANLPALVVANPMDYQFVQKLAEQEPGHQQLFGRVSTSNETEADSVGNINDLTHLSKKLDAREIIFCPGKLPIQQVFENMHLLGPTIHYRFHLEGSRSIVGSYGHNASDEHLALRPVSQLLHK
ncbi:MAG: glycosyltransferase family 2 protein [Bacteroidota bacterium]